MRHKNIIVTIAVMVLGLGALVWFTQSQAPQNGNSSSISDSSSSLTAETVNYDFGEVSMAAGDVAYDYLIKNSGSEPVTIDKIYTSCMCTTAELIKGDGRRGPFGMPGHGGAPRVNETINPDEEVIIRVVFDPAAHGPAGIGLVERVVYIEDKNGGILPLSFTATVTP